MARRVIFGTFLASATLLCFSLSSLFSIESTSDDYSITFEPMLTVRHENSTSRRLIVDVMSVGSQERLHYLEAQQKSWASHWSIRHFFPITELDDREPNCANETSWSEVENWIEKCRDRFRKSFDFQYRYLPKNWVWKKKNPVGWVCAQKRWGNGFGKIGRFYRNNTLPDLLLVVDDDTMIQMEILLEEMASVNVETPLVFAGCLTVQQRFQYLRFSPIGGDGLIFTKASIHRFVQPLQCKHKSSDAVQNEVCSTLDLNMIRERRAVAMSSSLTDLIDHMSNRYPNCFISDQLVGHFVNYYYLSEPWTGEPLFNNISRPPRIHPYKGSSFVEIHREREDPLNMTANYTCWAVSEGNVECTATSPICHYVDDQTMIRVSNEWLNKNIRH